MEFCIDFDRDILPKDVGIEEVVPVAADQKTGNKRGEPGRRARVQG